MTHFASADEDPEFTAQQVERFEPFVRALRDRWPGIVVHAANSAATLRAPASHFDLVRCGIAMYGCDPMNVDPDAHGLEPALELSSYVAAVKRAASGESAGYGRRFIAEAETWIATVPIGYGDGIRRALTNNLDVLIAGRRYPLVGTVSMDNITVDVAAPDRVAVGDRVTIIGRDGDGRQTAEEIARRIGTINYEIVCGLSTRVSRAYHRDGSAGVTSVDPMEALAEIVRDPAWLVGGAVRDRLLGRSTDDYDVVVDGDARQAARELARVTGAHAFALSEEFGVWRVVARGHSWQVDVLPVGDGSIEDNLAGRDFTANAIAEPLGGGPYADPFGGVQDVG